MSIENVANRTAMYLRKRAEVNGLDPDDIHIVNGYPLLVQDLWALVRAARGQGSTAEDRVAPQLGDVVHAVLARGSVVSCVAAIVSARYVDSAPSERQVNLHIFEHDGVKRLVCASHYLPVTPRVAGTWHYKHECPSR